MADETSVILAKAAQVILEEAKGHASSIINYPLHEAIKNIDEFLNLYEGTFS